MTITDEHLAETTEYNGSKIPWNSINKIETVSDNTYVFTGELTAYIIPHKKIIDGDASQFVTKLNDAFKRTVG